MDCRVKLNSGCILGGVPKLFILICRLTHLTTISICHLVVIEFYDYYWADSQYIYKNKCHFVPFIHSI